MSGAEAMGVVRAKSVLAQEILDRCQVEGADGVISFPVDWQDFRNGHLW